MNEEKESLEEEGEEQEKREKGETLFLHIRGLFPKVKKEFKAYCALHKISMTRKIEELMAKTVIKERERKRSKRISN